MFFKDVCQTLRSFDVEFAIAGGYACVLHGVVRGTIDIDIVLSVSEKNYLNAEAALKSIGLQPRLPVVADEVYRFRREYIDKRNMIAWSFVDFKDPGRVVDLLIASDLKKIRVVTKKVFGTEIPLVSLHDLIKMKRAAGRPQDIEDIKHLEAIREKK